MKKTRLSLYYLASYLMIGGLAFFIKPELTLDLLQSTHNYSPDVVKLVGLMFIALGLVVIELIRIKAYNMYPVTLRVRAVLMIGLFALYALSHDMMFLILLAVVLVGVILTLVAYKMDKKAANANVHSRK